MRDERLQTILVSASLALLCAAAISEAAWSPAQRLDGRGDYPFGHAVATEGKTVHVVWLGTLTKRPWSTALYHRRSDDCGETWNPPLALAEVNVWADEVDLAVSGKELHIVWVDGIEIPAGLYYAVSRDGGREWSEPLRISPDGQAGYQPSIAALGEHVFVAYRAGPADRGRVVVAASQDGGRSWFLKGARARRTGEEDAHPRIGLSEGSAPDQLRVHLAWTVSLLFPAETPDPEIWYQVSDDLGRSWFKPQRVSPEGGDQGFGWIDVVDLVTLDPSVHVAWNRQGLDLEIHHNGSVRGAFGVPTRLDAPASQRRSNWGEYDQLALTGAGSVLQAAWVEAYPETRRRRTVFVARSGDRGRSWGSPKRLARGFDLGVALATSSATAPSCSGAAHLVYRKELRNPGSGVTKLLYRRRPAFVK